MISCYILSEASSMHTLKEYIEWFPYTKLCGKSCPNSLDLTSIAKDNPHILFVDIALASSHKSILLEIGQSLTIIYIGNCYSNAYDAFDTLGFDLLLMPLTFSRFEMSMNKFKRFYLLTAKENLKIEKAITDSFFVKVDYKGQKEVLVKCKDVIFMEALQNQVTLHLVNEKILVCHNTMKEMEESLPREIFIRIHKSFIINYNQITTIEGNSVMLNENYKVSVGSTYKKSFTERKNQKMIRKKNCLEKFNYSITASICLFTILFSYVHTLYFTAVNPF